MAQAKDETTVEIGGREVVITSPAKLLIPAARVTKLDLVNYYLAVAEGALRGAGGRPCILVRYLLTCNRLAPPSREAGGL